MLKIRQSQMDALGISVQARFELELCDVFIDVYPRECRQAGGREAILSWVRIGLRSAAQAGYTSRHECGRWLALMFILGVDFAADPQLPWVLECLDPGVEPDPTARIDDLFDTTLRYLKETAGNDAELVVRALVRIRNIDFGQLPDLQGEAAIADACERLQTIYPEKFSFQGSLLTSQTVAQQLQRASEFGLRGPAGRFLFVLLSFVLGNGFDQDPLHGWASAILHREAAHSDGDCASELEVASRAHLAMSLTAP